MVIPSVAAYYSNDIQDQDDEQSDESELFEFEPSETESENENVGRECSDQDGMFCCVNKHYIIIVSCL